MSRSGRRTFALSLPTVIRPSHMTLDEATDGFKARLDVLTSQCIFGSVHVRMWNAIREAALGEHGQIIDWAKNFFFMTLKGHEDSAMVTLARLFDDHKDAVSIPRFLNYIEQNAKRVFPSNLERAIEWLQLSRDRLAVYEPTVATLQTRRDKFYAHLDTVLLKDASGLDTPKLLRDNLVTMQDAENIYEVVGDVLNGFSDLFDGTSTQIGFVREDDFDSVMTLMVEGNAAIRKRQDARGL